MLRHTLRRVLSIAPILLGITLAAFLVLSYVPDPADDPRLETVLGASPVAELRRSRFLDLPRFFNVHPVDLRVLVDDAVVHIAADDQGAPAARATLERVGGAALPYLVPRLDAFDPTARGRIAEALAPVAIRMSILGTETGTDAASVTFWNRFWADRSIDFRDAAARRAARRLSQHATSMREANLLELDTYALEEVMRELELAGRQRAVEGVRRLAEVAGHVTGRDDPLPENASSMDASTCALRWQDWWLVHRADYVIYDGPGRIFAMVMDTQYAKWAERFFSQRFRSGSEGRRVIDTLRARAPETILICLCSLLIAYALAVACGLANALRREGAGDAAVLSITLVAHAVPTAALAAALASGFGHPGLLVPSLTLACALVASPTWQHRAALLTVLHQDYIRTARAMGVSPGRIVFHHATRNALLPLVALFTVEMPTMLGGAFVVEKAFGIEGLGEETVRAVTTHDVRWLLLLALAAALTATLTSLAGDITAAAIDPRLASTIFRRRRALE